MSQEEILRKHYPIRTPKQFFCEQIIAEKGGKTKFFKMYQNYELRSFYQKARHNRKHYNNQILAVDWLLGHKIITFSNLNLILKNNEKIFWIFPFLQAKELCANR